jgi:UDP-N-acetylglucosamine 4,6-dehydratase
MTRFWITLDQAVELVVNGLMHMQGGEIFVPKIPSMKIVDLAKAIAPECEIEVIGIRPGEKLHEALITEEDGRNTVSCSDMYVIMPSYPWWERKNYHSGQKLQDGFTYTSNHNTEWLTVEDLKGIIHGSQWAKEAPSERLVKTIHNLNERIILNLLDSEGNIPDKGHPIVMS